MIAKILNRALAALALLVSSAQIAAADAAVYIGGGNPQVGDPLQSDATPMSLGVLGFSPDGMVYGFDFGLEGTMLDSTWGQDSLTQAQSFNLVIGHNLSQVGEGRLDIGALIGMRSTFSDCADSYLGYQCYADTAPLTEYAVNYGVVMTYSVRNMLFGLRATGESVQALVGVHF